MVSLSLQTVPTYFLLIWSYSLPVSEQKWVDGGFTDSLPILPVGRTITVSPFAGTQDVCPVHRGRFNHHLRLANMDIIVCINSPSSLIQSDEFIYFLSPEKHRIYKTLWQLFF